MSLGKKLREARTRKGLTQEDAAKHLGITFQALSNYERDIRDPDTDLLKNIADLYGVTTDYLLGRTNIRTPIETIAAHHDGDGDYTEEELEAIEEFKEFVRSRRQKQKE